MKYFNDINNLDELKAAYRNLAKQMHPDHGGSTEKMQELNKEYQFLTAKLLKGENFTDQQRDQEANFADVYPEIIDQIINLEGLNIEICGCWIWVSGNTFGHKTALKSAGFYWASKKLMWYYRPADQKTQNHGKTYQMDQIRAKFGSMSVKPGKHSISY